MYRMFQKKVKCDFCNEEFNRTYLSKPIKRCLTEKLHLNDNKSINNNDENIIKNTKENNNNNNNDNGRPFVRFLKTMKLPLSRNETM